MTEAFKEADARLLYWTGPDLKAADARLCLTGSHGTGLHLTGLDLKEEAPSLLILRMEGLGALMPLETPVELPQVLA